MDKMATCREDPVKWVVTHVTTTEETVISVPEEDPKETATTWATTTEATLWKEAATI
jgi:hypothetical protein